MILRYTYDELCTAVQALRRYQSDRSDNWVGNILFSDAQAMIRTGNESYATTAQRMLDRIDSTMQFPESWMVQWRNDVQGVYPIIPNVIMDSSPYTMKSRKRVTTDLAPIRIFATTIIPAWATAEQMTTRFSAIAALVLALQRYRAVELHTVCSTNYGTGDPADIIDVTIPSKPISLAHAGFVCHPAYMRHLLYSLAYNKFHCSSSIPIARGVDSYIMEQLGCTSEDLYLPLVDRQDIIMTDPVKWVGIMVERFMNGTVGSLGWE